MDMTDQIGRVAHFEALYDAVAGAVRELDGAMEAFEAVRPSMEELRTYYESSLWKRDFSADEAGRLPRSLKRGVLSEDGVYLLLEAAEKWDAAIRMINA